MRLTTNYGLKKPEGSDVVNIDDFNYNADILDSAIQEVKGKVDGLELKAEKVTISDTNNNFNSTNVEGALNELFQNVSNGKTLIASAITDKGVTTSSNSTFEQMANSIGEIKTFEYVSFYEKILYSDNTSISSSKGEKLGHTFTASDNCGIKATVYGKCGNSLTKGSIYIRHYRGDVLINKWSLSLNGKTSDTPLTTTIDSVLKGDEVRSYVSFSDGSSVTVKKFSITCSLKEV